MIEYTSLKGELPFQLNKGKAKMEDYGFDFGWGWWDECGDDDWDDYDDW